MDDEQINELASTLAEFFTQGVLEVVGTSVEPSEVRDHTIFVVTAVGCKMLQVALSNVVNSNQSQSNEVVQQAVDTYIKHVSDILRPTDLTELRRSMRNAEQNWRPN